MYSISILIYLADQCKIYEKLNNDPNEVLWKQESPEVSQRLYK